MIVITTHLGGSLEEYLVYSKCTTLSGISKDFLGVDSVLVYCDLVQFCGYFDQDDLVSISRTFDDQGTAQISK